MPAPTPEAFAALARSSPWRWSTLRFTVRWTGPYPTWDEPVRAWIRRPDGLRVETTAGEVVTAGFEERRTVGALSADGGRTVTLPRVAEAGAPAPVLRGDGLVAVRPVAPHLDLDDPMFQDYRWVAMLDPAELADGRDGGPAVGLAAVTEVEHGGRAAWEAVARPLPGYEPRCGCCPLLRSRDVDLAEYGPGAVQLLPAYPEGYRVRLDVATGVCVLTEPIGDRTAVAGHDLRIEAVDEPLGDRLFVQPRGGPFRRG